MGCVYQAHLLVNRVSRAATLVMARLNGSRDEDSDSDKGIYDQASLSRYRLHRPGGLGFQCRLRDGSVGSAGTGCSPNVGDGWGDDDRRGCPSGGSWDDVAKVSGFGFGIWRCSASRFASP